MDPISQGAVGAAFAQQSSNREHMRAYAVFGCLAGMAPDLDVFIQSATDPLMFLEYHRHFTHALAFIPMGALIVSAALFKVWKHPLTFKQAYLACFVGYATHGLLDACTSYGTQLFWPFSSVRVAWNNVSVVDPLFTFPLLALVVTANRRRSRRWTLAAIIWIFTYLGLGAIQHSRALDAAETQALAQGHEPKRLTVKPGFANILVWKSIYEHNNMYYVDAVRVVGSASWCPGKQVVKLNIKKHLPELPTNSQQAQDIERFRWFSDDYLAPYGKPGEIIDVRYAAVPNDITPLWGIRVDSQAEVSQHAEFVPNRRANPEQTQALWALIKGQGCNPI